MSDTAEATRKSSPHPEGSFSSPRPDDQLFRDLMDRFTILAERCAQFSREIYRWSGTPPEVDLEGTVRRNLKIARTIFGKWSLDILAVIHLNRAIGFADIQKTLGRISRPVLAGKLRQLERAGLIQRNSMSSRPPASRYSLTHKGLMISRLGEPVFLYLRLAGGWQNPPPPQAASDESSEKAPIPTAADES